MLILRRALTRREVRDLFESGAHFGEELLPESRADRADLKVLEDGQEIEFELLGAAPLVGPVDSAPDGVAVYAAMAGEALGRFGDEGGATDVPDDSPLVEIGELAPAALGAGFAVEAWAWFGDEPRIEDGPATYRLLVRQSTCDDIEGGRWSMSVDEQGRVSASLARLGQDEFAEIVADDTAPFEHRWVHVGLDYDGQAATLYVDGMRQGYSVVDVDDSVDAPGVYVGGQGEERCGGVGLVVDDVAVHDVHRGVDWFWRRSQALPRVRFLARTSDQPGLDNRLPFADYALQIGGPGPWPAQGRADGLLLSAGRGWFGVWSDWDRRRGHMPDLATAHRHATLIDTTQKALVTGVQEINAARTLTVDALAWPRTDDPGSPPHTLMSLYGEGDCTRMELQATRGHLAVAWAGAACG